MKVVVIQGPNLNMLGIREQHIYGPMKLDEIHKNMEGLAKAQGITLEFFQSNFEGEIVDRIQECLGTAQGIIINPAAYSHTSIAIRDALLAVQLPVIEVHISNIYARESFRKHSLTAEVATSTLSGFGPFGYHLALVAMHNLLQQISHLQSQQQQQV